MSSVLGSQGLFLATAMAVSTTLLFLAFPRQNKIFSPSQFSQDQNSRQPNSQVLRSCFSSGDKKREKKRKKVKFAENVKDPSGNGEEFRKRQKEKSETRIHQINSCRSQIPGIPKNRIALYNGILRDRSHRMECSY